LTHSQRLLRRHRIMTPSISDLPLLIAATLRGTDRNGHDQANGPPIHAKTATVLGTSARYARSNSPPTKCQPPEMDIVLMVGTSCNRTIIIALDACCRFVILGSFRSLHADVKHRSCIDTKSLSRSIPQVLTKILPSSCQDPSLRRSSPQGLALSL
jgi:hypothetical protein